MRASKLGGNGEQGVRVRDGSLGNRIEGVIARDRTSGLEVNGDSEIVITGVDFAGDDGGGLALFNVDGVTLDDTIGFGFGAVFGCAIELHNVHNSTISGLDVSWAGDGQVGYGIWASEGSSNNLIEDVAVEQRLYGLEIHGDSQIQIADVDFSDSYYGLRLFDVEEVHLDGSIGGGFGTVTYPIELYNSVDSIISGIDVSWTGKARLSGPGSDWVRGGGATGSRTSKPKDRGFSLTTDSQIEISGVDFSESWTALGVWNVDGFVLHRPIGTGMDTDFGYVIRLHNAASS